MKTSPLFDDALLIAQMHGMVPPPKGGSVPAPARKWSEEPSCTSVYPESMFANDIGTVTVIKNMCAACPARVDCLAASIENREEYGIWAGLQASERALLFTVLEGQESDPSHG